ncbi:hypothetical protein CPB86DRAFT_19331 [Serendipita vermifera]|nr:hypothetical protein CPB86DRAFT_19331 [Serendipita vermifera]
MSHTNSIPEAQPTSRFDHSQSHSFVPYSEAYPIASAQSVTPTNLRPYEYPTSYAQILQPMPVPAYTQHQVQDLLDSNPSSDINTQLTPRAHPPPELHNTFSRTPTIHVPAPLQTSYPSIPPYDAVGSARKSKKVSCSNEGFTSNLKKKFSTSSASMMRRVSDMKDKEAELARPTNSRQGWPCKYEADVFTEEDLKLPAAKRRRIYINSLEQYCNTLNELMRIHDLLAEPKPFAKEVKGRDTKLVAVALENRIVNLRSHLAALSRASLLNPNSTSLEPDPHLPPHPFSQASLK